MATDDAGSRETERAVELAYRAVGQRERTVAELRTFLERKRVEPEAIDEAVAELTEAGLLDDARYARRFAEDKRELERWGSERIARDLQPARRRARPDRGGARPTAAASRARHGAAACCEQRFGAAARRPRARPRLAPAGPPRLRAPSSPTRRCARYERGRREPPEPARPR